MMDAWIAALTLFIITLGFAGILGGLIFRLRTEPKVFLAFLSLMIGSLVFFPPLSLPVMLQWLVWLAALIIAGTFAMRPANLPAFLLSRRFVLRYACLALLTTAMWYQSVGPSLLMSSLTITALLTALVSWRESLQW